MRYYCSIFKNSKVLEVTPGPNGKAMSVSFELEGQPLIGLNAGPQFKFTEAISLFVSCTDQAEVDELWSKLSAGGGEESSCGWVKDKFGLWWQIIPTVLGEALGDKDPAKAKRALDAMLKMKKIDIKTLEAARKG
jgi:predicted 3-demethylubiquinone-9 3-methyltransferase (glyoxalase superfamily)